MIFQIRISFLRLLLLNGLLFLTGQASFAQESFIIDDASREYAMRVQMAMCHSERPNSNFCNGAANISLYRKGTASPFQVLNLPNVQISRDSIAHNPQLSPRPRQLYEETYSFVFEDFNFDGEEDLAIWTGNNGGYGGPSYNVYLYSRRAGRFIENRRLSRLTEGGYLGLFFVDPDRRHLIAYSKSGCCYHETDRYRLINNRPVLVEREINERGESVRIITTRRLVNGRWVRRVRREPIREESP